MAAPAPRLERKSPDPAATRKRGSLLAVTSEAPWPLDSGGHLRTYHLLRRLAAVFDVRLVAPTRGGDAGGREALEDAGVRPRLVALPPRTAISESLKVGL